MWGCYRHRVSSRWGGFMLPTWKSHSRLGLSQQGLQNLLLPWDGDISFWVTKWWRQPKCWGTTLRAKGLQWGHGAGSKSLSGCFHPTTTSPQIFFNNLKWRDTRWLSSFNQIWQSSAWRLIKFVPIFMKARSLEREKVSLMLPPFPFKGDPGVWSHLRRTPGKVPMWTLLPTPQPLKCSSPNS